MKDLPFVVERDVVICATRATVFRYFTDTARFEAWWGKGSRIDARPGGEVFIRYGNGQTAQGTVLELAPPARIVFTFGYDRPDTPLPPESSRVTITLSETPGGTHVRLEHHVATEALRAEHVAGWRYLMGVFAHLVAADQHSGATALIDRYLGAWSETDATARRAALAAACAADVVYRDPYGFAAGRDDLDGHIAAAQRHLPARLARDGEIRLEAGIALIDWTASKEGADAPVARGTSVVELAPDGTIARVTGFWR